MLDFVKIFLKNIKNHILGKCPICGKLTLFICIDLETARNNMLCFFCKSSSRSRHVAKIIIQNILKDINSLSEIIHTNISENNFTIYNTCTDDSITKILIPYKGFICSDFFQDIKSGHEIREKTFCQNIEKLTFDSKKFDLIITEDIFEHVRNYKQGFQEIHRTLKPGGHHIFTIPCFFDSPTLTRVDTSTGQDRPLMEPEYHGDPVRGKILAYRTFGMDLFDILASIGFETRVFFSKYSDFKNGIVDSYVFLSRKMS